MGNIVDTTKSLILSSQPYGSSFTDIDTFSYKTENLISISSSTGINQTQCVQKQYIVSKDIVWIFKVDHVVSCA